MLILWSYTVQDLCDTYYKDPEHWLSDLQVIVLRKRAKPENLWSWKKMDLGTMVYFIWKQLVNEGYSFQLQNPCNCAVLFQCFSPSHFFSFNLQVHEYLLWLLLDRPLFRWPLLSANVSVGLSVCLSVCGQYILSKALIDFDRTWLFLLFHDQVVRVSIWSPYMPGLPHD